MGGALSGADYLIPAKLAWAEVQTMAGKLALDPRGNLTFSLPMTKGIPTKQWY